MIKIYVERKAIGQFHESYLIIVRSFLWVRIADIKWHVSNKILSNIQEWEETYYLMISWLIKLSQYSLHSLSKNGWHLPRKRETPDFDPRWHNDTSVNDTRIDLSLSGITVWLQAICAAVREKQWLRAGRTCIGSRSPTHYTDVMTLDV